MPGLSFLLKKPWHPQTIENQKKLFVAEHSDADRRAREEEAAREVAKEAELQRYESAGDLEMRDPKTSSLKFMYSNPQLKSSASAPAIQHPPQGDDDDDVKKFWARMKGQEAAIDSNDASGSLASALPTGDVGAEGSSSRSVPLGNDSKQSALEKLVGKAPNSHLSREELESRHPRLKNAPVVGEYARGMELHHKPFNDVVRNVRCIRCGQWGHQTGDRECSMAHELNPYDLARQRKEDPMNFMTGDGIIQEVRCLPESRGGASMLFQRSFFSAETKTHIEESGSHCCILQLEAE
jgi:CBF1 interacting corepressor